ncbi:hypothetical protein KQI77_05385 [Clostridium sp. MSJ-8]|uniref:hypothetical protein n=1 Tax=Clostridium sp. MSJ-8 TaxID=2841510 RepID=UPI001C0EE8E9|nr:hypothetical protein [Clostridium sp. MSJ-8]MBU5487596.1 hypothetical protein [Clostridium sp. MSJ-8]
MKRLKRVALLLITLTMLMSAVVANAAVSQDTLSKVQAKIVEAGVPNSVATSMVDYISTTNMSAADANALIGKISSLESKYAGVDFNSKDITASEKQQYFAEAQSVAQSFGMNLTIGDDNKITVTDFRSTDLGTYKAADLKETVLGSDSSKLKEALTLVVDAQLVSDDAKVPTVDGGKNTTTTTDANGNQVTLFDAAVKNPIMATEMKKTASNNGNLLLAGVMLIALGGTVYAVSRKKVVA